MRLTEDEYAALRKAHGIVMPVAPAEKPAGPKFKSKAEARFAQLLEARKKSGEILGWRYEAVTLRLADGVRYTPDFLVEASNRRMTLIEVKGGYIRDDARIKLRVAVEMFPGFDWWLVLARRQGFVTERLS